LLNACEQLIKTIVYQKKDWKYVED
jgi:hypothetical protein